MWDQLFELSSRRNISLQSQLREQLVAAVLDGHIPADKALPSGRELAKQLGVARNTVVLTYQHLVDDGYLISRERRGYFVNPKMLNGRVSASTSSTHKSSRHDWNSRFRFKPSTQHNIVKPRNWEGYDYPFISGQPDASLIPVNDWRECCRRALSISSIQETARDRVDNDDPLLIDQIRTRMLPRRGIWASKEEILITLGAQHALYLLASLLVSDRHVVGFEDPGYPDARNIFKKCTPSITTLPVDGEGVVIDARVNACDYVYVTPSHQSPTTVTMSAKRRQTLLEQADKSDFLVIEDDYECESNFRGNPTAALKSRDQNNRVIYVGSLSKTLAPGLRVGYLVGPAELIHEARSLRRLMVRHPPANNQRIVALFLSLGHHDSLINRLSHCHKQRWQVMGSALDRHLPDSSHMPTYGGTSYWVKGPRELNTKELYPRALEHGILFEPGDVYFDSEPPPKHYLRLGFSSISVDRIEPGIRKLAELIHGKSNC